MQAWVHVCVNVREIQFKVPSIGTPINGKRCGGESSVAQNQYGSKPKCINIINARKQLDTYARVHNPESQGAQVTESTPGQER